MWLREQYLEKYYEYRNFSEKEDDYSVFHRPAGKINVDSVLKFIMRTDEENCKTKTHEELYLKGDISWGAEKQFENEALMAVRTANFISAFLQVVDPKEIFPGTRVVDKPLTEDQMIGALTG